MENSNDVQKTTNIGTELLTDVMPSCFTCYYSGNGKHSCDRHINKLKPDYSKGVECYYNNYAHYRLGDVSGSLSFKEKMKQDIIPFVERMIKKEKEHLYWLESKNAPKEFIKKSKLYLNHFRQRHKEYIEYADGLS